MSTALAEKPGKPTLRAEMNALRERLASLEQEVAQLRARAATPPQRDWAAAFQRFREDWNSMDPEFQQEALAALEEAERRSRAPRVEE